MGLNPAGALLFFCFQNTLTTDCAQLVNESEAIDAEIVTSPERLEAEMKQSQKIKEEVGF